MPAEGAYASLPFLTRRTDASSKCFVRMALDSAFGTATFSLAYAHQDAHPSSLQSFEWLKFGGALTGIQGSVFPIVGIMGKGDSAFLYPDPPSAEGPLDPPARSESSLSAAMCTEHTYAYTYTYTCTCTNTYVHPAAAPSRCLPRFLVLGPCA